MITEEELAGLAQPPAHAASRPLAEIERRAGELRRGRRLRLAAVAAVAAAAVAVTVGPLGGLADRTTQPAGGTADCSSGYGHRRSYADLPELLFLPPESVSGPITGPVLVRDDENGCARLPPAAIHYSLQDGVIGARLELHGPGARNEYAAGGFQGETGTADLDGATAAVYRTDDLGGWTYVAWTAADGSRWSATATGMGDGALAAIRAVTSPGGRPDPGVSPPGLDRSVPVPQRPATKHHPYVLVGYAGNAWTLRSRPDGWESEARAGAEAVDIAGTPGWWITEKGMMTELQWRDADGILHQIGGTDSLEFALTVARSLVKVPPDDPRLLAAREPGRRG